MERKRILGNAKSSKTLIRDSEVKIDRSNKVVVKHVNATDSTNCKSKSILKNNDHSANKFSQPQINSTKNIIKQMENLEKMDFETYKKNLDVREINEKVTKTTNFHFNKSIYKDLVALNMNDLTVTSKPRSKSPHRKFVPTRSRDIEPKLDDFYKDAKVPDKPVMVSAVKVKLSPISTYDGCDIYRKVNSWKSHK